MELLGVPEGGASQGSKYQLGAGERVRGTSAMGEDKYQGLQEGAGNDGKIDSNLGERVPKPEPQVSENTSADTAPC